MGERRLMADTRRVIETDGDAIHRWHAARKWGDPVLVGDRPWDRAGAFVYGSVLAEGGRLRLWYQARSAVRGGNSHAVAYAESDDGINWCKPELGLVDFEGSRANNLTNLALHNTSVGRLAGEHAETHAHPYWATGHAWSRTSTGEGVPAYPANGVYLWRSADGLRWERDGGGPLWRTGADAPPDPSYGAASDVNTVVYDPYRRRYLAAAKLHVTVEGAQRRAFAVRTSRDLRHWSEPRMAIAPDGIDDLRARELGADRADFYGLTFHVYPAFILGFVWMFYVVPARPAERWPARPGVRGFGWSRHGRIAEVQPVFSYDGEYWIRPRGRPAFVAAGERGAWDAGNVATAAYPVTIGDEHFHYYGGGPVYHGAIGEDTPFRPELGVFTSIGLARMGRDRYASYSATTGGSVLVYHGPAGGARLRVNARAPYGAVHAQVLDAGGRELPGLGIVECVPFSGDSVSGQVRWANADLAAVPAGAEIAIRFVLNEADLFGYEVAG